MSNRSDIPSQQEQILQAFRGNIPNIAPPAPPYPIGAPPGNSYVTSVFPDAKPFAAYEIKRAQDDTGQILFVVPDSTNLLIREFSIDAVPLIDASADTPVTSANGVSNFWCRVDFLVNDIASPGGSNIITSQLPFGTWNESVYVVANGGDTVEMRLTPLNSSLLPDGNYIASGRVMEWTGTLFTANGLDALFAPTNTTPQPVVRGA